MRFRILVAFSLILLFLLILPYLVTVKDVRCNSQFGSCSPHIVSGTDELVGVTYKNLEKQIALNDVLQSEVDAFTYYFIPPSQLVVNVIEKKGAIAVRSEAEEEFHIVSLDQTFISTAENTQLPKLYIDSSDYIDHPDFGFCIELLSSLSQYYSVNEAIWTNNSFLIVYNESTEIVFPTQGDIDVLLGSLEVMLFRLNSALQNSKISNVSADKIHTIDLRYKNPIIK